MVQVLFIGVFFEKFGFEVFLYWDRLVPNDNKGSISSNLKRTLCQISLSSK
jgi:hypothetical protein